MKAEYFPPKEDVILQNEAPTDFYILVTGAVVIIELCPLFCGPIIKCLNFLTLLSKIEVSFFWFSLMIVSNI